MNITHMSVSRKTVWDECKKKYHYKYHLKLEPEEEEPFYFTYGKIIHKIAEEYVLKRGSVELKEITESVINGEVPIERGADSDVFAPKIPMELFLMPIISFLRICYLAQTIILKDDHLLYPELKLKERSSY